jgi:hypothetical protein
MRIIQKWILCAFLLLAGSSAEASISYPFSPSRNLSIIYNEAQHLSVTNTPVNTLQPVCNVLKEKKVTGYSFKQWYVLGLSTKVFGASVFFLIVLLLTHTFLRISMGMALFLLAFFFVSSFVTIFNTGPFPFIIIGIAAGIVMTRDYPRVGKVLMGLCLATLVVSFLAMKRVNLKTFSYMDDYSFPEYLVSSTSTNRVIIHEKMELPYGKYGNVRKELLYRDGRRSFVRPHQLTALLQAQAEEIRMFKQVTQPQDKE